MKTEKEAWDERDFFGRRMLLGLAKIFRSGGWHNYFAETVWVRYNENIIDLKGILDLFFRVIDPTVRNRQGNDFGTQYRTGIYYISAADEAEIRRYVAGLRQKYARPVVTEVEKLRNYYTAEPYHQNYLEKHPEGYCHIGKEAFQYAGTYTPLQTAR